MADSPNPRERRLVQRLLAYWRDLAPDGELPALASVEGARIADMWGACFTVDIVAGTPVFGYVGETHVTHHGDDLTGRPVSAAGPDSLLGRAVDYLDDVLLRQVPVSYGGEFPGPGGVPVPYRSILLPLSDDGETVTAVLGGANCRLPEFE